MVRFSLPSSIFFFNLIFFHSGAVPLPEILFLVPSNSPSDSSMCKEAKWQTKLLHCLLKKCT